jgi:FkbM family methyltransferase
MFDLSPENIPYLYFSQTGEDHLVLAYHPKSDGFFVDVGAFHPIELSNTFSLYLRGWRGINIEPNPRMTELFRQLRPEDLTLQCGVSRSVKEMEYISFSQPSCNTFSKAFAETVLKHDDQYKIQPKREKIPTKPLTMILDEHFPKGQSFDLLTIDVEGMDFEVLESLDWTRYRPILVLVEDHHFNIESPQDSKIYRFMKSKGYTFAAKTLFTLLFHETEALDRKRKFEVPPEIG